jgi:uncharacterized membrane protein YecN with MAPEG domain
VGGKEKGGCGQAALAARKIHLTPQQASKSSNSISLHAFLTQPVAAMRKKSGSGDSQCRNPQSPGVLGTSKPANEGMTTMTFEVTPLYALPLAVIYLALWFRVTSLRAAMGVSIGDGGNVALLQRIRQHGNFAEWTCFVLILMILAEGMGAPAVYLHVSGALLLIGRLAHPFGLRIDNAAHPLRYVGNGTNILAALNAMVCLGVNILGL